LPKPQPLNGKKTFGGISDDYANSVIKTTDGEYIVAGYTTSNDGEVAGNHGGFNDALIMKVAPDNVNNQIIPIFNQIPPVCYYNAQSVQLPLTSINGITGTWTPQLFFPSPHTSTYTFIPDPGQNAANAEMTIVVVNEPSLDNNITWSSVGNSGGANNYGYISIVINSNNIPYIASNTNSSSPVPVKRLNGNTWESVGNPNFTLGANVRMVMNSMGEPYVISTEGNVYFFNGINWETLGSQFKSGVDVSGTDIAINSLGVIYIVYTDLNTSECKVKFFDGSNWVQVGTPVSLTSGYSNGIAIDPSGIPYIICDDVQSGNGFSVKKFDGNNWVLVGNNIENWLTSNTFGVNNSIVIDSNGIVYIASQDQYSVNSVLLRYDGNNWIGVTNSGKLNNNKSLAIGPDNYIYFASESNFPIGPGIVSDSDDIYKIDSNGVIIDTILGQYNGSTNGTLAIGANNVPYYAFQENVIKYDPDGGLTGNRTICSSIPQSYSVNGFINATSFIWTLPQGWTGSSNTSTINVIPNSTSGNISVYATNSCGNSVSASFPITVTPSIVPTFDPIEPINAGELISDLPVVSTNNISGTWLPALNNTTTTTYTFTPSSGVCVSNTTLTIVVNPIAPPTGSPQQNFEAGQTLSNLMVSGTNIVWYASYYDAVNHINPLSNTTLLVDGTTYYAIQTINGISSETPLAVTVSYTLSNIVFEKENFIFYPNPVKKILYLKTTDKIAIDHLRILDISGKIIFEQTQNTSQINLEQLANGMYIIQAFSGEEQFTSKFIKE